jgi:hypothetical protein
MPTDYFLTPSSTNATFVDTTGDGNSDKLVINISGTLYPGNVPCQIAMSLVDELTSGTYSFVSPSMKNHISVTIGGTTYPNIPVASVNMPPYTSNTITITDPGTPGFNLVGRFDFDADEAGLPGFVNGNFFAVRTN